jgi:molybdopterin synthase sulfurtransferase
LFEKEILFWNKVADSEIMTIMSEHGIQFDTLVILYSQESPLPAARVLHLLLYSGVRDVRLMDGGMKKWKNMKFEASFESFIRFKPDSSYGTLMYTRKHD